MLRRLSQLWQRLFRSREFERDLAEEIEASFNMMVERLVARGMTPAAARRAARADFEGVELGIHDRFPGSPFHAILQDFRYAGRGCSRAFRHTGKTRAATTHTLGRSREHSDARLLFAREGNRYPRR